MNSLEHQDKQRAELSYTYLLKYKKNFNSFLPIFTYEELHK